MRAWFTGYAVYLNSDIHLTEYDTILSSVTDLNSHSLDLSNYKIIRINAVWPNGGSSSTEINVSSLSLMAINIALTNGYFSNSNYYGGITLVVSYSSIKASQFSKGTGIKNDPYYDVYGFK